MTHEPNAETRLDGITCVVTGASRGIGRATADALASHGARVAICARSAEAIHDVADVLRESHDAEVHGAAVDVTDADGLRHFAAESAARLGPASVLVNSAGILGPVGPIDAIDLDTWHAAFAVNFAGVVNACNAFVPQLRAGSRGSIVNLSGAGVGGPRVPARMSAYFTSKAAVVALTETLAAELAEDAIQVNAVAPGPVATGLMDGVLESGPEVAGRELYEATRSHQDAVNVPPAFLDLVLFLASEESTWLTGRLLSARWDPVDSLRARQREITGSALLTMRRVDGELYHEAP